MEHANIQPNYTAALHTLNRNHTISAGGWVQGISTNNYHTQFNIYGAEWTPEKISFYFNDNIFYTVTKKQAGGGVGSFSFIDPVPADGNYFIYQDGVDYGGRFTLNGGVATITNPGCNYDSTRYVSGAVPNGARMTITNSVSCNTSDTHWPFDQKFWLKLNLSVGGAYGGNPNGGDWSIPHTMEVDWVKVYQK
jgi:beta-glucanase (GH16 family)